MDRLESEVRTGLKSPLTVGYALLRVHEKKLYVHDAPTFSAYIKERLPFGRIQAFRLMAAARMHRAMEPVQGLLPDNEAQFRELTKYPVETAQQLWQRAVELSDGKRVAAPLIVQAAYEIEDIEDPTRISPQRQSKLAALTELHKAVYLLQFTLERRMEEGPRQELNPILAKMERAINQLMT